MKLVFDVSYDHPVELVFSYLSDPETWHEWVPAVIERTKITDGPIGPGTKWKAVDRYGPWRFRFTDELVEIIPNQRVLFQHDPVNAETEYRLERDEANTVAHVRFEGNLKGPNGVNGCHARPVGDQDLQSRPGKARFLPRQETWFLNPLQGP